MAVEILSEETPIPSPLLEMEVKFGPIEEKGYGVNIFAKSPEWEALFKKISGGKKIFWKKNGVEAELYDLPGGGEGGLFNDLSPSGKGIIQAPIAGVGPSTIALFFLRAPTLSTGVETFFPGIFEEETIKRYMMLAGERSQGLFKKLSPGSMKMKIWMGDFR